MTDNNYLQDLFVMRHDALTSSSKRFKIKVHSDDFYAVNSKKNEERGKRGYRQ